MKRHTLLLLLAGLILFTGRACTARASRQLPADIRCQFGSIDITDTACWDGDGSTWFLLVRTPDHVNRLLCYTLENGTWMQRIQTSEAVPQGDERVRIVITNRVQDFAGSRTIPGPILLIMQYGSGEYESSVLLHYAFQRTASGEWKLFSAAFQEEQVRLDFEEDSITFRTPAGQDHYASQTVQGTFERDLRRVRFPEIPRTPGQAQEILRRQQP